MESTDLISCQPETDPGMQKGIIQWFYVQEANEWHRMVHKNAGVVWDNVEDSFSEMTERSLFYKVSVGRRLAAFFVTFEEDGKAALEGFHIKKEFRTKEFIPSFWAAVKGKIGKSFSTSIFHKNKAAIDHLKRQGFTEVKTYEHDNKLFHLLRLNM